MTFWLGSPPSRVLSVVSGALVLVALQGCAWDAAPPADAAGSEPAVPALARDLSPAGLELTAEATRLVARSPHVALGVPADDDDGDDHLLDRGAYVVSYNAGRRSANWVSWRLEAADLGSAARTNAFRADSDLPAELPVVGPDAYARSGWDRGHLCPSGDRTRSARTNALTFLMTNIVPQAPALNRGPWRDLEEDLRATSRREDTALYVVAGTVSSRNDPALPSGVPVAAFHYKVIVALPRGAGPSDARADDGVLAVLMPNGDEAQGHPWTDFAVAVDDVEAATGYDFFSALPPGVQARLEAQRGAALRPRFSRADDSSLRWQ